jgi:hypothetical protein
MVPDASLGYLADLLDSGQTATLISADDKPRAALPAPAAVPQIEAPVRAAAPAPTAADRIAAARQAQAAQPVQERPRAAPAPQPVETVFAEPEPMSDDLDDLLTGAGFGFPS